MSNCKQILSGVGSCQWRRDRGLLTISDHRSSYLSIRQPRGPYAVPLPGDLLLGVADIARARL